jgi:hypothetical protein
MISSIHYLDLSQLYLVISSQWSIKNQYYYYLMDCFLSLILLSFREKLNLILHHNLILNCFRDLIILLILIL